MKLSTKGRYGLRAILDLALNAKGEVVPLSEIAIRQGGYKLARDPKTLSVGEILRTLEGDLDPVKCSEITGEGDSCSASDNCVTKHVWKRISESINSAVDTLMLSDLIEEGRKVNSDIYDDESLIEKPICR